MDQSREATTKEKILQVSIDLFAQKGFRDVSVREIAAALGIKASSLYKHYQSKEDILEHIFILFRQTMEQTAFPQEQLRQAIGLLSPGRFLQESFERFKRIMWDPTIARIAKIITIEQQRNRSVRQFFLRELIDKPTQTLQFAFDLMVENGRIDPLDTGMLAQEYTAYVVYLYFEQNFLRESLSLEEIEQKMKQHNDFFAHHILARKGESGT